MLKTLKIATALSAFFCFNALPSWAKERAAVLDLSPKGNITASDASILTDRIRSLMVQSGPYEIIERENMDRILREQGFQATQNCDTTDCSVAIGKILSVRHMITGSASRLGNLYSLNLRIIDVEKGSILKEEYVDCLCPLESLMTQLAPELVRKVLNTGSAPSAVEQRPASQSEAGLPVRQARPWLIYLEGGWPRYASGGAFYHFGPYFALGASAGVTTGSFTISPHLALSPRVYFNPHDLAGFLELVAVLPLINLNGFSFKPRLGIEYRQPNTGLNLSLAVGPNLFSASGDYTIFDATASLGYAF